MATTVVSSGTTSYGTVLERGDVQQVYGRAIGTKVYAGGREEVFSGGITSGTVVIGNRNNADDLAALVVSSGGLAVETTVLSQGRLIVESGGETFSTVVNAKSSDGPTSYEIVSAGGVTNYTELNDYGWEVVSSGGTSRDTYVDGGREQVLDGGTAGHTTINAGTLAMVGSTAIDTRVNAGGSELVYSGATAVNTVVSGSLRVVSGGHFVPDAEMRVYHGGVAVDTTLDNVASTAVDDGTLAFRGDRTFAEQGIITGNGALVVSGSGTTVELLQNNTYTGGTRIDAGVLELDWPHAAGTGPITFLGGSTGTLRLEQTIVSNTISGFLPGATIDLGGFGLATAVTLGAGNVLTVSGGRYGLGGQVRLNLDPTQSYAGYTFRLGADGHGGTDLTVVPASPSTAVGI